MFSHQAFRNLALAVSAAAVISCGDYAGITSPTQSRNLPPTRIVGASFAFVTGGSVAKAVKWGPSHSRVDQTVSAIVGPDASESKALSGTSEIRMES